MNQNSQIICFGFRPNRSCHDCLKYLNYCIEKKYTNYILDADIQGYFDNIDHELIIKGLEMHIGDKRLIRLIRRFLKVGIMENGEHKISEYGTPQRLNTKSSASKYSNVLWNNIVCRKDKTAGKRICRNSELCR